MKRVLIVSMVLLLGVTLVAGCGSSETVSSSTTSPSIPVGWKVFEGDRVSLALPATFEGGKPTDADVAAMLEQAIAFDPNMAQYEGMVKSGNMELLLFGEPDAHGSMPTVLVMREPSQSGISMERYTESFLETAKSMNDTPGEDVTVRTESVSKDEARLWFSRSFGGTSLTQFYVLHKVGSNVYGTIYTSGLSSTEMDPVFRVSADTIVVKE